MESRNITNEEVMELTVQEHEDYASKCEVKSEIQLHEAGEFLVTLKKLIKEVEAWFAPMIEDAFKAHKTICAKRNFYTDPLKEAEAKIKQKIGAFQMELDRVREEEERQAREAAEKQAEEARTNLLARAEKATLLGQQDKAQELLNAAAEVYVPAVPVITGNIKPAGVGVRYEFIPEVTDKRSVPDDYKVVDLPALKRVGNATKDNPPTIAGIRWVKRPVVSGRTK